MLFQSGLLQNKWFVFCYSFSSVYLQKETLLRGQSVSCEIILSKLVKWRKKGKNPHVTYFVDI